MELSFGQRIDPQNGLVESWLTHGALDEIKSMDLSDKVIWMFGAGMGDIWLAKRCKHLHIVETVDEWIYKEQILISANKIDNITHHYRPCADSSGEQEMYCHIPNDIQVDIIINDANYRTEVVEMAIKYFKQKKGGGILICDNYWQDYVWKSPIAIEWLEPFEKHIHSQSDHTHFEEEGCEWKTAIIFIK